LICNILAQVELGNVELGKTTTIGPRMNLENLWMVSQRKELESGANWKEYTSQNRFEHLSTSRYVYTSLVRCSMHVPPAPWK